MPSFNADQIDSPAIEYFIEISCWGWIPVKYSNCLKEIDGATQELITTGKIKLHKIDRRYDN